MERCHQWRGGKGTNSTAGSEAVQGKDCSNNKRVAGSPLQMPSSTHFSLFISPDFKVQGRQVSSAVRVEAKGTDKRSTSRRCRSGPENILVGCSGLSFQRSFHYFLRPFLRRVAGAGSREALPGRVRVSKGSARRLGPRRGTLGRGSVNIHEAPPLLRGPPDPGARRSPLCPGLARCAHAGAASAGPRR